jgi:hypothetical protein
MLFPVMVMVLFLLSRSKFRLSLESSICLYHLPINIARLIATLQYSGEQNIRLTVRQCKSVSVCCFFGKKMHKIVTSSNRLYRVMGRKRGVERGPLEIFLHLLGGQDEIINESTQNHQPTPPS